MGWGQQRPFAARPAGGTPAQFSSPPAGTMATPQGPSLPPSVEGRVRAGIRLSVRGLAWAKQYPGRGRDGFVRAKWWGQTDGGTLVKPPVSGVPFSPDIGRAGDVSFPVRCPLTKLIHYLSDAHHLVLDVVDTKKQRAVGRAKVPFKVATARLGTVIASFSATLQTGASCRCYRTKGNGLRPRSSVLKKTSWATLYGTWQMTST